jgi:hypothetical protein
MPLQRNVIAIQHDDGGAGERHIEFRLASPVDD